MSRTRFAFITNRTDYLLKSGLTEQDAVTKANDDYRLVARLSGDCVMTLAGRPLPGKGDTLCNRTACQSDKHVVFHNFVMDKNYCLNCATDIRFCNNLNELDLYPEYNEALDKLLEDNIQ